MKKNFFILILLVVIGCQCVSYATAKNELKRVQDDYMNLQICIEEGIL